MRDLCGPILREESALLVRKQARTPTPCHGERLRIADRYINILGGEEEARKYMERTARLRQLPK